MPVRVEQKKQQNATVIQKSNKSESQQTRKLKSKTPKVVPQQIWKQKVDLPKSKQILKPKTSKLESKQIWKPKNDSSKRNVQNDLGFYQSNVSKGQVWVAKKQMTSVSDNWNENVFVKNDKDFPKMNDSYCATIPKVKQTWVKLFM
ncbi:hypothetical protein Hanom_Chr05g00412231 [Helianthus anomalus]